MKVLTIGNVSLEIKRRPRTSEKPRTLDASALGSLNEALLDYVKTLSAEEISRRISPLVVTSLSSESDMQAVQMRIDKYGIAVVDNFISEEGLDQGCSLAACVKSLLQKHATEDTVESESYVIQRERILFTSYADFVRQSKPILNVRRGPDLGMVDVFNVDRLANLESDAVRAPFHNPHLLEILSNGTAPTSPQNLNLYMNCGITKTRGFHVDSYERSLKGFVYLTDVLSTDNGPYCYVVGSHKDSPWRIANQTIGTVCADSSQSAYSNTTESPLVAPLDIVPMLAKRGTLILSDQCGIHRGLPQSPTGERQALVMNYS